MGVAGAQSRTSVQIPQSAKGASYVGLELSLRSVRLRLRAQQRGRHLALSGEDR